MAHEIVMRDKRYKSGWNYLYGHDCWTKEQMDRYCAALDPKGLTLKVVELPFDVNDEKNFSESPVVEQKQVQISPETASKMLDMWDKLVKGER